MASAQKIPPPSSLLPPLFLAGPTAVGKSAVALVLAEKIGGEIISVDSMQVYRGLDLGTAKPTADEQRKIPHHLVNICDLHEPFDAAQFIRRAQKAVAEIQSRGHSPVFCGGTGLYFKAYREGLGAAPPSDEKLRAELENAPLELLLAELRERDPAAYEKIDRQNPRRVIRAVEVIRLTGEKFSGQRAEWGTASRISNPESQLFCLTRAPDVLHRRISQRVDEMFSRGLVDETRELLKQGLAENQHAMQAIGYRQVVEHLRGEHTLAATIELVKIRTRQFSKRQLTWFRRHGNCQWLEIQDGDSLEKTLEKIIPR